MRHSSRRRLVTQAAAGIFLLSRLAATMASSSSSSSDGSGVLPNEELCALEHGEGGAGREYPRARVCRPLAVSNFNRPSVSLAQPPPRDKTPHLGDGVRSAESSGVFFDSLDRDGDGAIEPEEVAMFLQNEIGGKHFDTQVEVDQEVGTIMARLDLNHNDGLEMSDMLVYWNQLESLLSAEEVADWIVYSVQLPSSVGNLFLENGITGYDFLEIVENKGQLLLDELGIAKESFRNKIVRRMQARMLGIGSSPETPLNFTYKLESCGAVTLSWERSTARVFPIHSYRLQRRGIHLIGAGSSSKESISTGFDSSLTSLNSDWKTVYVGGDNEFVDTSIETGHNYMYRIQAWNSVGKSGWETIDLSQALKKQRCSTKPSQPKLVSISKRGIPAHVEIDSSEEWAPTPQRIVWGIVAFIRFIYNSMRIVFALLAMLAGSMRYRRATATSSSSAVLVLPAPWLWKGMNRVTMKLVGQEFIPRSMLGDQEALKRQEKLHDEKIMATGLRGYTRSRQTSDVLEGENDRNNSDLVDRRSALDRRRSLSTNDIRSINVTFAPPTEVVVQNGGKSPNNKFGWLTPSNKQKGNISSVSEVSVASAESEESSACFPANTNASKSSTSEKISVNPDRRNSLIISGKVCSECMKKFKIGKRYKHHCARCMATFCHKHGRTTHSNFTSCKIPGDCICNSCLASS